MWSTCSSLVKSNRRFRKFARVPNISLSVLDSFIWENECNCLGIPSVILADSQTSYDNIAYPIIANQRSILLHV